MIKLPFIKRSKYDLLKKEHDALIGKEKQLDRTINIIYNIVLGWRKKKMGNLKAISEISKRFIK